MPKRRVLTSSGAIGAGDDDYIGRAVAKGHRFRYADEEISNSRTSGTISIRSSWPTWNTVTVRGRTIAIAAGA